MDNGRVQLAHLCGSCDPLFPFLHSCMLILKNSNGSNDHVPFTLEKDIEMSAVDVNLEKFTSSRKSIIWLTLSHLP